VRLSQASMTVGGRLAVKWYMTDAAAVTLKLDQITRRGRIRPLGSIPFAGRPGPNAVLFSGRLPRRRPLRLGSYRFTVTAATPDGRVAAPARLRFTVRRK
jgi:hypothetical protein